jgi:hypothetical protein
MGKNITAGFDIAKHVFQVHGVDVHGTVVVRRKLRRSEVLDFFDKLPCSMIGLGGLRYSSLLGTPDTSSWSRGAADAALLCEALRQAPEERYGRR